MDMRRAVGREAQALSGLWRLTSNAFVFGLEASHRADHTSVFSGPQWGSHRSDHTSQVDAQAWIIVVL